MPNYRDDSKGAFFQLLQGQVTDEYRIETEADLRLAEGKQKLEHKNRRLEVELEKSRGQNASLQNDRALKKIVAMAVFILLGIETIFMFTVLLFQGFHTGSFHISDVTLNIFVPATILQISSMAIIITRHLFHPKTKPHDL